MAQFMSVNTLYVVPGTGIEPVRPLFRKAADFKSAVSTNFTTRASEWSSLPDAGPYYASPRLCQSATEKLFVSSQQLWHFILPLEFVEHSVAPKLPHDFSTFGIVEEINDFARHVDGVIVFRIQRGLLG